MTDDERDTSSNKRPPPTRGEVSEAIKSELAGLLDIDIDTVKNESKLEDDLGMDSLDFVEMVDHLEDRFDSLEVDMRRLSNLSKLPGVVTVSDLVNLISEYLEKGDAALTELDDKSVPPP